MMHHALGCIPPHLLLQIPPHHPNQMRVAGDLKKKQQNKNLCSTSCSAVKRALMASAQRELRVLSPAARLQTLDVELLVNRALMVVCEIV